VIRIGEAARDKAPGAIRLTTYNIENLFDERDDLSLNDREDDWYDREDGVRAKPAAQREAVAAAIRAIDSDIVAVQEIESFDALVEFREMHLKGLGYDHAMSVEVGSERGIECGVLSRFPIREVRAWPQMDLGGVHPDLYGSQPNWNAGEPIVFRRSPLFVRIEVPAGARGNEKPYELGLFVVHHKSGKFNNYWREKETVAVARLVKDLEAREPGLNIAVVGDFNAETSDPEVRTYLDAGLSQALESASGDSKTLTHSSGRAIDFILVNQNLRADFVAGSAFAFGTPVLPEDADWRTTPAPRDYASDHMPVSVDITPIDR
jgi:endonuclease/exonuclease/phosphatase family metal-dependent hydrolase